MARWLYVLALLAVLSLARPAEGVGSHSALLELDDGDEQPLFEDYHLNSAEDDMAFERSPEAREMDAGSDGMDELMDTSSLLEDDADAPSSDLPTDDLPVPSYRTGRQCSSMPTLEVRKNMLNTNYRRVCVRWSRKACKVAVVVRMPKISKRYRGLLKTGKVKQRVCGKATYGKASDCQFRSQKATCTTVRKLVDAYNARVRDAVDRVVHCFLRHRSASRCSDPVVAEKKKSGSKGASSKGASKKLKQMIKGAKGGKATKVAAKKKKNWWMWGKDTRDVKSSALWMPGPLLDTPTFTGQKRKIKTHGGKVSRKGSVKIKSGSHAKRVKCRGSEKAFRVAERKYMHRDDHCTKGSKRQIGECYERLRKKFVTTRKAMRRCHKKYYH